VCEAPDNIAISTPAASANCYFWRCASACHDVVRDGSKRRLSDRHHIMSSRISRFSLLYISSLVHIQVRDGLTLKV